MKPLGSCKDTKEAITLLKLADKPHNSQWDLQKHICDLIAVICKGYNREEFLLSRY